jgi:hypothetical protein
MAEHERCKVGGIFMRRRIWSVVLVHMALSRQLGNSTEMIDRQYSKYSPLLNAEVHSGRKR